MDLEFVEASWRTGRYLTSDLPRIAGQLAAAGHDAPALRLLRDTAAEEVPGEGRELFELGLRELGRGAMTASEAALLIARRFAGQVVARKISARAGTKAIALVRWKGTADVDERLRPFSDLDDLYDDVGVGRLGRLRAVRLNRVARNEARRLLD